MNKSERTAVLRRLKPATWYAFSQMEAMHEEEVKISKTELALKLDLSLPTLTKHLQTWASHNLVQEIDGGFRIAQMDGKPSNITEDPIIREFKSAKDIIDYWCDIYKEVYGTLINYNKSIDTKSDATRQRIHSTVRSFFEWLVWAGVIWSQDDPSKGTFKKITPHTDIASKCLLQSEVEKLMEYSYPDPRDFAMIRVLSITGVRISELVNMK